jgi:predicted transcriptional regulator
MLFKSTNRDKRIISETLTELQKNILNELLKLYNCRREKIACKANWKPRVSVDNLKYLKDVKLFKGLHMEVMKIV